MEGLGAWYRAMAPSVKRYLTAVSGNPSLAEDLTQETFLQALRTWGRIAPEDEGAYLIGIARHAWATHVRRETRRRAAEANSAVTPDTSGIPFSDGSDWLPSLDPDDRVVLVARAIWGLPFRDVADSLGRTENWARVRYFRLLTRLRDELGRELSEGDDARDRG